MAGSVGDLDAGEVRLYNELATKQWGLALPQGQTLLPAAVFKTQPPDGTGEGACRFLFPAAHVLRCLAPHFGVSTTAESLRKQHFRMVRGRGWSVGQPSDGALLAKNVYTMPQGEHAPGRKGLSATDTSEDAMCLVDVDGVRLMMVNMATPRGGAAEEKSKQYADAWMKAGGLWREITQPEEDAGGAVRASLEKTLQAAQEDGSITAEQAQSLVDKIWPTEKLLRHLKGVTSNVGDRGSSNHKLSRDEQRELHKTLTSLTQHRADDGGAVPSGRQSTIDMIVGDDLLLAEIMKSEGAQTMVDILAGNLVCQARGVLDLLSGIIALRMPQNVYDNEVQPLVRVMRHVFADKSLLTYRARAMAALKENIVPGPTYTMTFAPDGSIGMHTTIEKVLDFLSNFPSWRQTMKVPKGNIGVVVSCDGAKLGAKGGVVSTVMWFLNMVDLPQSSRQVFTLALSNGDDNAQQLLYHHHPVFKNIADTGVWQDPHDDSSNGTYMLKVWRVADGKSLRMELARDTAAGVFPCARCYILRWQLHDFWSQCEMDLDLDDYDRVRVEQAAGMGATKRDTESQAEFSRRMHGWTGSVRPLTTTPPQDWAAQVLHWQLRCTGSIFARLIAMSRRWGGAELEKKMRMHARREDAITVSITDHTGGSASAKTHSASVGGDSLHVLMHKWSQDGSFTDHFPPEVRVPLRRVLRLVTQLLYVLAHTETRPQWWPWWEVDGLLCGQALVAVLGPDAITPTIHETFQHGAQKLREAQEIETWLGLEGQGNILDRLRENAAEKAHGIRAHDHDRTARGSNVRVRMRERDRQDGQEHGEAAAPSTESRPHDDKGRDILVNACAMADVLERQYIEFAVREIFPHECCQGQVVTRRRRIEAQSKRPASTDKLPRRAYAHAFVSNSVVLEWRQRKQLPTRVTAVPAATQDRAMTKIDGEQPRTDPEADERHGRTELEDAGRHSSDSEDDSGDVEGAAASEAGDSTAAEGERAMADSVDKSTVGPTDENEDHDTHDLSPDVREASTLTPESPDGLAGGPLPAISRGSVQTRLDRMYVPNMGKKKAEYVCHGPAQTRFVPKDLQVKLLFSDRSVAIEGYFDTDPGTKRRVLLADLDGFCEDLVGVNGTRGFGVRACLGSVSCAKQVKDMQKNKTTWAPDPDNPAMSSPHGWWRFYFGEWKGHNRIEQLPDRSYLRVPQITQPCFEQHAVAKALAGSRRDASYGLQQRMEPILTHPQCVSDFLDALFDLGAETHEQLNALHAGTQPPSDADLNAVILGFRAASLKCFQTFEEACNGQQAPEHLRSKPRSALDIGEDRDDAHDEEDAAPAAQTPRDSTVGDG